MAGLHERLLGNDRTYHHKMILRTIAFLSALMGIILVSYIIHRWSDYGPVGTWYIGETIMTGAQRFILLAYIPLGLTVFWYILNLMFFAIRRRPIHPGWNVGADLVLTLLYIFWTVRTCGPAYRQYRYDRTICRPRRVEAITTGDDETTTTTIETRQATGPNALRIFPTDDTMPYVLECGNPRLSAAMLAAAIGLLSLIFLHLLLWLWSIFDTSYRRRQDAAVKEMPEDMTYDRNVSRGGLRNARVEEIDIDV